MKKLLLVCFVFFFLCANSNAQDLSGENNKRGFYVGGSLGMAALNDSDWTDSELPGVVIEVESDTGFAGHAFGGYAFENGIRLEGEIGGQFNDLNKATFQGNSIELDGDIEIFSFMVNGYFDFLNSSRFTPFVTAGIGSAQVYLNDFNGSSEDYDDVVAAFQVGAGVGYALTEKVTLDCKYRYFLTSDPELDATTKVTVSSHNLYFGARVSF